VSPAPTFRGFIAVGWVVYRGRTMIYVVFAHPYPSQSRANRALLDALRDLPRIEVCSLYDRYPDFDIDVVAEQAALARAQLVLWMHPVYWYSVPGLLKHWFDKVFAYGWAYGDGSAALSGKDCLWVASTGGTREAYAATGIHERPFGDFARPIEETARFCRMNWLEPFIVHGAHEIDEAELAAHALRLRERLQAWLAAHDDRAGPSP
jgi:glutathione-regulated potassium-efflux system ancillary protein KefF